jgi:NitT/TauT family transport system substrate-binding protein
MKFTKRAKGIVVLLLASLLLLGTLSVLNCSSEKKQTVKLTPLSFRLKWLIYSSFASHFVALDRGYFRDEGLNVTINPGGPGVDPIRLVATGGDDVGLAGYEQILMAREKGIPVVAIGEDYVRSGVGFFSLKDSGINKPEDFIGIKSVLYRVATNILFIWR